MKPLVAYVRRPDWAPHRALVDALRDAMDDLDLVEEADLTDEQRATVTAVVADGPSAEQLASLPRLAFVQSTWAGVERILPVVPDGVAVARMIDPQLTATMTEAVLAWTLYLHRDMPRYAAQQDRHDWTPLDPVLAADRRLGLLGLGALGSDAARALCRQGFDVAGWSRSAKTIDGVECLSGDTGFELLLARSDIVVNLLPHTDDTAGLLGQDAFAAMPADGALVNFGRGETVDDDALLRALDDGHLSHAVLDVFTVEPLPDDHPYWDHPNVTVLPHVSGPTSPSTAAVIAAGDVRRFLLDGTLPTASLVDRARGY